MTKLSLEILHTIVAHHVLIDLRDPKDYQAGHLSNATNIPVAELSERSHELPTRFVPLNLIGTKHDLDLASVILQDKNYNIDKSYIAEHAFWRLAEELGLLQRNTFSRRLWQANTLLDESIDLIESKINGRIGLDVGCGSGRDLTFLGMRGWQMTGVDYIKSSLLKAERLAELNGVTAKFVCTDIEKSPESLNQFRADLVIVIRYLHRPLFSNLKALLNPGGIIVYQTFLEAAKFYGKPKNPNFLLRKGELTELFNDFDIIIDREDRLPDDRPVASFIAQKR